MNMAPLLLVGCRTVIVILTTLPYCGGLARPTWNNEHESRRLFLTKTAITVATIGCLLPVDAVFANGHDGGILIPGGKARLDPVTVGMWESHPTMISKLAQSRIDTIQLSPLQQGPFDGNQELYYPQFLFGSWNVTATLRQKIYPFGTKYLPSQSLLEGSPRKQNEVVGDSCTYEVHYFSTLPNTLANQLTVNLGSGMPESKIIQDRAYNVRAISKAYQQLSTVQDVQWDYRTNPTRVLLDFGTGAMTDDLRPLGPRHVEIYINARQSELVDQDSITNRETADPNVDVGVTGPSSSSDVSDVFACAERSRLVSLSAANVVVSDLETITEFHKGLDDNHLDAISRIAVYLSPNPNGREGILWEQVGGKAVAMFDYQLNMQRILDQFTLADGTVVSRACVPTPRDVIQCD